MAAAVMFTNELLCFVKFNFGKVPKSEIVTILNGFYDDDEVCRAKGVLFEAVNSMADKVDGLPRLKVRKEGINKRRLDCEDILNLVELLDKKSISLPEFCAVNLNRIPRLDPLDVDTVRTAQSVEDLRQQVHTLTSQFSDLKQMLLAMNCSTVHPEAPDRAQCGSSMQETVVSDPPRVIVDSVSTANEVSTPSFASMFMTKDDQGQWFVQSKTKKKPTMVRKIITRGDTNHSTSGTVKLKSVTVSSKPKVWHTFVGRLDPETTEEAVCDHLSEVGINVVKCTALPKREKWQEKHAAFRIVVNIDHKDRMFDDDVWPTGTDVRDWVFTSRSDNGDS